MDNNINYSISLTPIGIDKVSKVPAIINNIAQSVNSVNAAASPLDRLFGVLNNIEKILMEIGRVGVGSFNKLNDIWATNHQGFNRINSQAEKLEKEIDKIGKTSKKSGQDVKNGFLDNFNKLGFAIQTVKNIAGTVARVIGPVFQEGMARQNAVTDFSTLLGIPDPEEAKKAAKKYADDLRTTDAASLYGTSTLNENAKNMLAYGVDAETTFQTLESLGDIAMGDKNKMNSLAIAFSQMWGIGKLQTQDWKQMVGAGFNPFNQMEKDLGKTKEELDEMMSKGKITAEMTRDAFLHATQISYQKKNEKTGEIETLYTYDEETAKKDSIDGKYEKGQFFGALKNTMDNTLQGQLATLQGVFDNLKAKVFELILPFAQKLIPIIQEKLPPIIDALIPKLEALTPVFDGIIWVITQLFEYITNNIDELSTLAVGIGIVAGAIAVCTSPITGIVIAIGALIAVLVQVIKYWDDWGKYVIFICPPLTLVMNLIMSIKRHWDSIVDGFKNGGILEGLKRISLTLIDAVLAPFQNLLEMIAEIPGMKKILRVDLAIKGVQSLRDKVNGLLPEPAKSETQTNEAQQGDTQTDLENAVNGGKGGKGGLGNTTKGKTEAVASGGTRNTQITINLGNMVETVNFNGGVEENAQTTVDLLTERLLRVLYAAQTAV